MAIRKRQVSVPRLAIIVETAMITALTTMGREFQAEVSVQAAVSQCRK